MSGIEIGQCLLLDADGLFELLDVLGAPLSEGSLCLPVALLPLLGRGINLLAMLERYSKMSKGPTTK